MRILCVVLIFGVTHVIAFVQPLPNLGDIRIKNPKCSIDSSGKKIVSGEAQVFLTDGSSNPKWSSICSNNFYTEEVETFCRQLGYQDGKVIKELTTWVDPVWIAKIDCKSNIYPHIFRCERTYKSNATRCMGQHGQAIVAVECSGIFDTNPYVGQVALCSPDDENDVQSCRSQSVSIGIVSVYFNSIWGALTYIPSTTTPILTEVITHYRGNLICQQMGFQQVIPGSIQTLSSYKLANYSFTRCMDPDAGLGVMHAWITTNDLYCESADYIDIQCTSTKDDPCFGCCYNYPSTMDEHLPIDDFIVVQCMYDAYNENPVPFGNKDKCLYEENGGNNEGKQMKHFNKYCARGSHQPNAAIILGVFFGISSLINIIILIIYGCHRYRKRKGYDNMNSTCFDRPNGRE